MTRFTTNYYRRCISGRGRLLTSLSAHRSSPCGTLSRRGVPRTGKRSTKGTPLSTHATPLAGDTESRAASVLGKLCLSRFSASNGWTCSRQEGGNGSSPGGILLPRSAKSGEFRRLRLYTPSLLPLKWLTYNSRNGSLRISFGRRPTRVSN